MDPRPEGYFERKCIAALCSFPVQPPSICRTSSRGRRAPLNLDPRSREYAVSPREREGDTVLLSKIKRRSGRRGALMEIASKKDAIGTRRRVNLDSKPACWIITCPYPSERWVIYGLTSVVLLLGAVSKVKSFWGEC